MAKNNDKRAERMARSNRNVNRAITVLMAGVIAEFYLLMVNNYYVKGGVGQVLTMMTVLQVIYSPENNWMPGSCVNLKQDQTNSSRM